MEIPAGIEEAVRRAVAGHLEAELGGRGLLLTPAALEAAEAEAALRGARLRVRLMGHAYGGQALEFESERTAARLDAALAFGAATARALAPGSRELEQGAGSLELLCALFNLGIGLVDSVCDNDAESGRALLGLVAAANLTEAAEIPRRQGWLRLRLPPALSDDPTVAFTAVVIEAFFEIFHLAYPDDRWLGLRRRVSAQLRAALEAERGTVVGSAEETGGEQLREQLIECSRLTSVLPFQIIEVLALGTNGPGDPSAGTHLGEAMWRIDDLVDICEDARRGSLNGVLLAALADSSDRGEGALLAALEGLPASRHIVCAAAEAASRLRAGLRRGGEEPEDHLRAAPFLYFIQRYAGVGPRPSS